NDEQFDEAQFETRLASNPALAPAGGVYHLRKLLARFHTGDYGAAIKAADRAKRLNPLLSRLMFAAADYHFYSALSHAACSGRGPDGGREKRLDTLAAHHRQLQVWAENCPENFESRAALVGAEIARIEGRAIDAIDLYERAIRSARESGWVQNEALAYELAARFYSARGLEEFTRLYLRNARQSYLRWGADGKARQLYELYPHLREDERLPSPTSTIGAPVEHLDLATVIKVSQAVSGEIVLDKLVDTVMRTAIEQAGAERGVLILSRGAERRIAAEVMISGDTVIVQLRNEAVTGEGLPESVLQYVLRARESVILDDAAAQSPFAADPYIRQRQARSVLCLPLLNQARLIGVLYLENDLARRVFVPGRTAVVKLLASQAAMALEVTYLYRDLEQREAKIRRLVDANIIGIFIREMTGEIDGPIVEANDAFLGTVGFDREDLLSGRIRWRVLTPPEWRDRDARAVAELKTTGTVQAYEKEYLRKDGSRVPVLVGAATLEDGAYALAFVLDLTERKRAEAEARESDLRYGEMQMELAHANRLATMGQLTASIAHEVNQPIGAVVANAQAALRWLGAQPPEL